MKRLLLIHPGTKSPFPGFGDTGAWGMPPLALGYIAALTPESWQIKIVDEYLEKLDVQESFDLVGISTYSVNATRAYELASIYRSRGIPVVLGGIHASMVPDEAIQYADSIVIGEAESVWGTVISDYERDKLKKTYRGKRLPLDHLPLPRRDLISDKYEMDVVQTTRGCPFGCEFCSVTAFNGGEYRMRPVRDVLDELEKTKKKLIYFIDDNICAGGKKGEERAKELFNGMIERKLNKLWLSQASINIGKSPEVLKLAYKSGCRSLFVGFESPLAENLKQINKSPNVAIGKEDSIRQAARAIRQAGIGIIGSFIIGFDHDDVTIFDKTLSLAEEADAVQFQILTPFPGTKLYDHLTRENRIVYDSFPHDWSRCDMDHLVIKPINIDIMDLVRGVDYMIDETFSMRAILARACRTLAYTRSITSTILAFSLNKDSRKIFAIQRNIKRRAQLLIV